MESLLCAGLCARHRGPIRGMLGLVLASGSFQFTKQINWETLRWEHVLNIQGVVWGEGVFSIGSPGKAAFEQGHSRWVEAIPGNSTGHPWGLGAPAGLAGGCGKFGLYSKFHGRCLAHWGALSSPTHRLCVLGRDVRPHGSPQSPQTIFSDVLFAAFHGWLRAETSRESGGRLCPEIFCRLSPSMLGVILG